MEKTTFVNKKELQAAIKKTIKDLRQNYKHSEKVLNENLFASNKGSYQFTTKFLNPDNGTNRLNNMIKTMIYNDVYQVELLSAGSNVVYLEFLFGLLDILSKDAFSKLIEGQIHQKDIDVAIERIKGFLLEAYKPIRAYTLYTTIRNICQDELLTSVCHQAIKVAGIEGKILVENSKQEKYTIEMKRGYSFELIPYKFFLENGAWDRQECKVLVVDGFIETVSEIDQVLVKANEFKQPMILVALGFSEEVVATLISNKNKDVLDVMPMRLTKDLSSLNVINDIGVVCGMDPISSLKGEMLTFVKYENLPVVEKVKITEHKTIIENQSTYNSVLAQVKMLVAKRFDNRFLEDVQVLLENRIKSLSPNVTTIYLPEMSAVNNDSVRIKIDQVLRETKTLLNYGVLDIIEFSDSICWNKITQEFDYEAKMPLANNLLEDLLFRSALKLSLSDYFREMPIDAHSTETREISILSTYLGIRTAFKTLLVLLQSGGFVKFDR